MIVHPTLTKKTEMKSKVLIFILIFTMITFSPIVNKQKSPQEKIADFSILFYRVNKSTEITPYLACLQTDRFLADCNLLLAFFLPLSASNRFPFLPFSATILLITSLWSYWWFENVCCCWLMALIVLDFLLGKGRGRAG